MLNSHQVMLLYTRVFENISLIKCISEKDIKQAIDNMHKIYQGSTNNLLKDLNYLTDYNSVAYRCAYLFKYAPFHTALAYKSMSHALTENPFELQATLDTLSGPLKLCSLGGGPGTDVIGVLAALHDKFGFFPISAKLIDIMSAWELTFRSVVDELRFGDPLFGSLSESVNEKWFDWSFITADLQSKMSKELTRALGAADVITMVKFVSAAACKETSIMIEKIFRIMKPGAFLLFVDNAGGGFEQLISSAASKYKLNTVFKPLKHQHYINETFFNIKFGYRSCYESKVAVHLLMKSRPRCQKMHVPLYENFNIGAESVNNCMNGHESFESGPFNLYGCNYPPSSELSLMIHMHKAQMNSPAGFFNSFDSDSSWNSSPHTAGSQNWPLSDENQNYDVDYRNESFESGLFQNQNYVDYQDESFEYGLSRNLPLNSTLQSTPFHRKPIRALNQACDPAYRNELMKSRGSWNASMNNSLHPFSPNNSLLPSPVSQNAYRSRLSTTITEDSGYPDESFESELAQDSSVCDSPLPFTAPQRVVRFKRPKRKSIYSSHEDESFWNTSVNRLPQHHDEDSLLSLVPYGPKEIGDSLCSPNPITPKSSLHQSWTGGHHPFTILQHLDKCKAPRVPGRFSVLPHEPYELARFEPNQSENISPSWQPSHQHLGKNKAPKRLASISKHRHNPYQRKKVRI